MSLYADDLMLYRTIHSQSDFLALQADVDRLCVWTDENCLTFNAVKCKYMIISRKREPTLPPSSIKVNDSPIARVDSYRYLGDICRKFALQKFALRAVTKDWKAGYDHLVSTCNLPTLQQCRRLLKLCALYQMVNGHLVLPDAPIQIRNLDRELRNTSQCRLPLQRPPAHTNAHLFFILSSCNCTLERTSISYAQL